MNKIKHMNQRIVMQFVTQKVQLMSSDVSFIFSLYALSLFYNVNIFYVYKNTYYEMFSNVSADSDTNTTPKIDAFRNGG